MNRRTTPPAHAAPGTVAHAAELEALQARLAVKVCAVLEQGVQDLDPAVAARLRVGREAALAQARSALVRVPVTQRRLVGAHGGSDSPDDDARGWWRFASVLPLLLLVAGFAAVHYIERDERIQAAAEVDAALLADDLPPSAYADPGFDEFLREPQTLAN